MVRRVKLALIAAATLAAFLAIPAEVTSARTPCRWGPPICASVHAESIEGVPATCRDETFVVRIRIVVGRKLTIDRIVVDVDERILSVRRDREASIPVDCGKLKPGRHILSVTSRDNLGRLARRTKVFRVLPRQPAPPAELTSARTPCRWGPPICASVHAESIEGVPATCRDETFVVRIRIGVGRKLKLRRVVVEVDHRVISVRRDRHAAIPVDCGDLKPGWHYLDVSVTDQFGRVARRSTPFRVLPRDPAPPAGR